MNIKQITPYLIALATFIIVALVYFSPVLEGKKLYQSDIAQFKGMSKEITDYRKEYHEEPYWTNAAFSGMPTYQVSAYFPHDYIKKLDQLIRFLPRPADYLMLYFLGFFILLMVLKIDWRLAILGALTFGFSTYLIIIIGVGHNAKAHAIGYMPFILAGVLLVFQKKYLLGFILTTLSVTLEIAAGHIQMTYYLFFMLLILGMVHFISALKEKALPSFFMAIGILLTAALISTTINANHLLPTRQYASESTRSKSELSISPDGKPKEITSGLSKDYITEYSYGILETFNLFIPRFMGGGNSENIGTNSYTYNFIKNKIGAKQANSFIKNAPTYWGKQPIVAAPAYIGAALIFLFVLSLFLLETKTKKWLLYSIILALLLSWGKNLSFLTNLFIDYIPLYNKFRAVSSIQVLIELAIPVLGILALQKTLFDNDTPSIKKEKAIKLASFITGGLALFFVLFGRSWFAFEGGNDAYFDSMIPGFSEALVHDRKSLFLKDSIRSLLLVLLTATSLFLYVKNKFKLLPTLGIVGILLLYDGISIAKKYVNSDDFVSATKVDKPFRISPMDKEILKDKSYYRVADFTANPMSDGSTSYFHKSIGGYHAAKPRRYQELFDYQIAKNNVEVLNMLNAKYMILSNEKGEKTVRENENIYGNAWFASQIIWTHTADEEMNALDSITKEKVILREKYKDLLPKIPIEKDSMASIEIVEYKANKLTYKSKSKNKSIALFSEMYYPYGWTAYVDGKVQNILLANYVLRSLILPPGEHEIVFKFAPSIVKKGSNISLIGYIVFVVLILLGFLFRKKFETKK